MIRGSRLRALRLASQRLVGSSFSRPVDTVRWMLAMQAQDFPGAKWSVGLRTPGITDAGVEAALASAAIVRSWPMRGTLHLTAAEDLKWILALTAPRVVAAHAKRRAALDLDEKSLERARTITEKRLAGRVVLTREELLAEIDAKGVSTHGQRGYHVLGHLALTGTLCFGPPRGKAQTFVLLDEWVKRSRRLERDEALGELALRYFTSHGPAATKDFTGWTKLAAADVKIALAVARSGLVELVVDGTSYWMAPDAEDHLSRIAAQVRGSVLALPGFDEYVLGYQDRSAVLADEHKPRIVPGGNGMFMPTLVVGGEIVGTWRRAKRKSASLIEPVAFAKVSRALLSGVEKAAQIYARFLGLGH